MFRISFILDKEGGGRDSLQSISSITETLAVLIFSQVLSSYVYHFPVFSEPSKHMHSITEATISMGVHGKIHKNKDIGVVLWKREDSWETVLEPLSTERELLRKMGIDFLAWHLFIGQEGVVLT